MGRFKNMAIMLLIMAAMVLFSSISVFASGFSVTVPLSLPIQQTSDGELVFAEGLVIKNNCSTDDVKVTNISLTNSDGWSIIDYSAEPSESGNEFALKINGSSFNADGSYPLVEDDWVIPNNSSLDLTYSAKSSLIEEGESVILGNVVFTVDIKPYEVEIPDDADDYYVPEENLSGEKADSLWVWYVDSDDNEAHITNYLGEYSENLELVVPTTLDGQYSPNGPAKVVSMEAGNFADKTLKSLYVPSGVKIKDSTWTNLTAEKLVLNGVTVGDSGFRRHNIDSIYATDSTLGEGAFYVNSDSTNVVSTLSLNNTSVGTSCFYYNTFDNVSISGGTLGETAFTYTTTNNKLSLLDGVVIQNSNCFANRSYADHSASINYLYIDVPAVVVTAGSLRTGPFENCIFDVVEFGPSCTELRENCFMGASINTIKGLSNLKTIGSQAIYNMVVATTIEPATLTNASIKSSGLQGSQNSSKLTFESLTLDSCSVESKAFYLQTFNELTISNSTLYQYAFGGIKVIGQCNIIDGTVFNDPLMFCIWNEESKTSFNRLYVDVPVVPTTNTTQYARGVFKSANVNELELGPNCTEVARYSFYMLVGLTDIKGLSNLKVIDERAFTPAASYTISDEVLLKDATIGQYAFSLNNASYVLTFDSLTLDSCDIGAYAFARDGFGNLTISGNSSIVGYSFLAITVSEEMQLLDNITFSSAAYLFASGSSVYPTINRLYVDTELNSTTGTNYPFFNYAVIEELEFGSGCTILYQKAFQSSMIGSIKGLSNIKTFGANCFATPQKMVSFTESVSIEGAEIGDSAFKGRSATVYYEFSDLTLSGVTFAGTYNFYYNTFDSLLLSNGTVADTNYLFNCATINYLEVDSTSTATKAAFSYGSSNTAHSFIADAVIDMPTVPSGAFRYCGIEYLYLGDNVSTVESSAFYNCANINVSMPATCTYESNSFPSTVVITVRDGSEAQTLDLREEEQAEEEQEEVVEEETKEEETTSDKETGETPVEDGTGGEDASDEGTSGENTSNDNTSNEDTSNEDTSNEGSEGNQNPETSGDDGVSNENTPEDSTPDNTTSGDSNGESGSDSTTDEIVDGESNSGESNSGESNSGESNEGTSNDASNDTSGETTPDDESGDVVVEDTETEGGNTSSEPVIPDNVGEDNVSGDETSSEEPVIDDTTSSNGEDEGTSSETTESETDTSVATPDENNNIESEGNETESGVENVETPAVEENVSEGDSTTSDEDGESATENTSTPEVPASTESASNETSTSGETTSNSSETTSKKASNGSKETEVSSSSTPAESVSEAA